MAMEFRLTFAGLLGPNKGVEAKHTLRQIFHRQLRNLWQRHAVLRDFVQLGERDARHAWPTLPAHGFEWYPLATRANSLHCEIDALILRPGEPGRTLSDVDNRLKVVIDALRMPNSKQELGRTQDGVAMQPSDGETPFYVLMEDDSLLSKVSVTTDTLLEDVEPANTRNVRMLLTVRVRPYRVTLNTTSFL